MIFSLIVCCDNNYGIGKNNKLPWKYSKDMNYFKNQTIDNNKLNVVIMGNNTYKSIPNSYKPLKNRFNIVLTKSDINILNNNEDNLKYFNNIDDILLYLHNNKEKFNDVYIIGGNQIYNIFLDLQIIQNIYLTSISEINYNCDIHFDFNKYKKYFEIQESNIEYDIDQLSDNKKNNKLIFNKYQYINHDEQQYINMINKVIKKGIYNLDRTKIGTISVFGKSFKYNIRNYRIPIFTHRKMFYRGIIEELLFFISGNTNTKLLEDKKVNIWKGNTSREFLDSRNLKHLPEGDLGAGYSFQLRHFGAEYIDCNTDYTNKGFDQLKYVIDLIKNDPHSRRILFSYWNPLAMKSMALPPCFPKDTLILTSNGYKYIQDVDINDKLYTHKGNWEKINNIQIKNYNDTMYRIKCRYNTKEIQTTKEHPFYVKDIIKSPDKCIIGMSDDPYWCTAEKLDKNKHIICLPINKKDIIPSFNIIKGINGTTTQNIIKKLDNINEWFMMGYYMGDGWLDLSTNKNRFNICFKKHKPNVYEIISKIVHLTMKTETDKIYTYECSNKIWFEILKEFGHKAHNKKIPEWIQDAPKEFIQSFINGYTEADGTIDYKYTTVSPHIAYGLQRLYAKLGKILSVRFQKKQPTCIIQNRIVNQRNLYSMSLSLQNKNKYISLIDDNYIYFPITTIESYNVTNTLVYNFEVNNDNSYTVQNLTVHNCHLLYQFHVNTEKNELSCSFYQRSSDFVLAANFNIVSAAVLTFMICHITGYKPGKIIHNIGDLHIYINHIEEAKKMLNNKPYNFPIFNINDPDKKIKNIEDFKYEDFQIMFYNSYQKYKFTMAI